MHRDCLVARARLQPNVHGDWLSNEDLNALHQRLSESGRSRFQRITAHRLRGKYEDSGIIRTARGPLAGVAAEKGNGGAGNNGSGAIPHHAAYCSGRHYRLSAQYRLQSRD